MSPEEKSRILNNWQRSIDSRRVNYSLIPYPYCDICFERLTPENVHTEGDKVVSICINCHQEEESKRGHR